MVDHIDRHPWSIDLCSVLIQRIDFVESPDVWSQIHRTRIDIGSTDICLVRILLCEGIVCLKARRKPLGEVMSDIETTRHTQKSASVHYTFRVVKSE